MRLERMSEPRPGQYVQCAKCFGMIPGEIAIADLDGPAGSLFHPWCIEGLSIYKQIVLTIPASEIDHHESDLYVKRTQASQAIVQHCNRSGIGCFRHQGAAWWDIPFAYEPFWEKGVIA